MVESFVFGFAIVMIVAAGVGVLLSVCAIVIMAAHESPLLRPVCACILCALIAAVNAGVANVAGKGQFPNVTVTTERSAQ